MSSKIKAVAQLLETHFNVTSLDHAEYLLNISDVDDVREWVTDALGLDESFESQISFFLSELLIIKESRDSRSLASRGNVNTMPHRVVKSIHVTEDATPFIPPSKPPIVKTFTVPTSRNVNRVKCYCLAKAEIGGHPLLGNCLNCGRIICDAEDYGPCLFCESPAETIHWLASNESADNKAVQHKDRLIQYDREGTRRTKIYDDSTDWFAEGSDIWKGKEEREAALQHAREFEEQKTLAKQQMKVEIDFATGKIKVKDKAGEIAAVEKSRDEKLANWIENTNRPADLALPQAIQPPKPSSANVLDRDSEEILSLIREKLGKVPKAISNAEHISIFSFLDDDVET